MDEPTDRGDGPQGTGAGQPPVDLTPRGADPAERQTALALTAVLEDRRGAGPVRGGASRGAAGTGLDTVLVDVQLRAARRHRRRTAAGALTAAAAVTLALAVPSLVPAAVVGRPAAGAPAPSAPVPEAGPSSSNADPLMSDAEVAALYPGATSSRTSGSIALGPSGAPSPAVGGYCGDSTLGADAPWQTWETSWRQPGAAGVRVREKVLRWEGAGAVEAVDRYTQATRDSPQRCDGPDGGTYESMIVTEPGGALPSRGVLALDGAGSAWRVRSISPAGDGRTVVELTVDLPAPDGREAARSIAPLLAAALSGAAPGDGQPSAGAATSVLPPGPVGALSDRPPAVPHSTPSQPQPSPAWRLPLSDASTLTLQQVRSVVPAPLPPPVVVPAPRVAPPRPLPLVYGCGGTSSLPPDVAGPADDRSAAWVARDAAGGRPVVEVSERVVRWDGWGEAQSYVSGMRDAATACTGDPADPYDRTARMSTPWREVQFRSADGAMVEALVRPAGADRPGTWALRAASALTVGTTAVDVQVTARAESPDALVAVMEPLLRAASERGAADQLRAFAGGGVDQRATP